MMSVATHKKNRIIEIIFFGRGGQGAVTAAQIAGRAAHLSGFKGVTAAPTFGAERRGAPVEAYLRLADFKINIYSNIEKCDYIVALDDSLIDKINKSVIKENQTVLIINSGDKSKIEEIGRLLKVAKIAYADAFEIAESLKLLVAGNVIINTPILGAFVKVTELFGMEFLKKSMTEKFSAKAAELNFNAALKTYNKTEIINING